MDRGERRDDPVPRLAGQSWVRNLVRVLLDQEEQQVLLVLYVAVQGGGPDPDLGGQPTDGQFLPAVPVDELTGRAQDLRTGGHGRSADGAAGCIALGHRPIIPFSLAAGACPERLRHGPRPDGRRRAAGPRPGGDVLGHGPRADAAEPAAARRAAVRERPRVKAMADTVRDIPWVRPEVNSPPGAVPAGPSGRQKVRRRGPTEQDSPARAAPLGSSLTSSDRLLS